MNNITRKIAVIGASSGQLPLIRKAKEKGLHTVCFAWENGAICKEACDDFYPISIFETDLIVDKCREWNVEGIVTTASEETAYAAALIADKLGLNGTSPEIFKRIQDKKEVRVLTDGIKDLYTPKVWTIENRDQIKYPCVVKPIRGSAKRGVSLCRGPKELEEAIEYGKATGYPLIIEEYLTGEEFSVEVLSYKGLHQTIQITRKVSTGYPHFVEVEHHQPAPLSRLVWRKVERVVSSILTTVGYTNGASHIEIKIDDERISLIEINPRGGGGRIADTLIGLSTDCDYLGGIIDISLNEYQPKEIHQKACSGILFLTAYTSRLLPFFESPLADWMVERVRINEHLTESTSNYNRDGYIIYKSKTPIIL